jgi:O-acetyl-ADP-ribose deacetylase (regulator of RNase III)
MGIQPPLDEHQIGRARIRIVKGDITSLRCDAIVNAANDHLWMGGGVAGAIKRRGGDEIEREAVRQGPIPVGEAVATGAGRLLCRHVIHAVTMGQDLTTSEGAIRSATRSALRLADRLGLGSMAFPALGTGVGGFPLARAATVMLEEVAAHVSTIDRHVDIIFAVRDDVAYRAFARALGRVHDANQANPWTGSSR